MTCPDCGTPQPVTARFCGRCGELLTAARPEDEPRGPPGRQRPTSVAIGLGVLGVAAAGFLLVAPAGDVVTPERRDVVLPADSARDVPSPSPMAPVAPAIVAGSTTGCAAADQVASFDCPQWQVAARDVTAKPVIDGDAVFVGTVDQLVALDATTGKLTWSVDLDGPVLHPPAIGPTDVYVVDARGHLTAIDRSTGESGWTVHAHSLVAPVLTEGTIALATVGKVTGHDVDDGSERWVVKLSGAPSPLAGTGDRVFVGDGNGDARAIDATTGEVVWRVGVDGWFVALHEDRAAVITSGLSGPLGALDHRTGERLWTSEVEIGWVEPHATLGSGRFHLVHDGRLWAIDPADGSGTPVAAVGTATSLTVGPQGLLYVIAEDGEVTVLTRDGTQLDTPAVEGRVRDLVVSWADGVPWMVAVDADRTRLVGLPAPSGPAP